MDRKKVEQYYTENVYIDGMPIAESLSDDELKSVTKTVGFAFWQLDQSLQVLMAHVLKAIKEDTDRLKRAINHRLTRRE